MASKKKTSKKKSWTDYEMCPRCRVHELSEHPAVSRTDNKTYVCPSCGTDEALIQFSQRMAMLDYEERFYRHLRKPVKP